MADEESIPVMEAQQTNIVEFQALLSKFKKSPTERRTVEKLKQYNDVRVKIWSSIEECHKLLMEDVNPPPPEYQDKYEIALAINNELMARMETWIPKKQSTKVRVTPPTPQQSTSQEHQGPMMRRSDVSSKSWRELIQEEEEDDEPKIDRKLMKDILGIVAGNQEHQHNFKPPEVKLKTFDGDVQKYYLFKQMFHKVMDKVKWDDTQKILFLYDKLEGAALTTISNLETVGTNYEAAWRLLDEAYDRPRQLLRATLELLNPTKKAKYQDADSLQDLINRVSSVQINMERLKTTLEDIQLDLTLQCADSTLQNRFEDYVHHVEKPTVPLLIRFLRKELDQCKCTANITTPSAWGKAEQKPTKPSASKSKVYITHNAEGITKCLICGNNHKTTDCDVFLGSDNRIELMKKHRLCLYCGKHKFDRANRCRSFKFLQCEKCNKNHITLLHPLEPTQVLHTQSEDRNHSILPTAIVHLRSSDNLSTQVRCLIDLCAERSYISSSLVQQLKLPTSKANLKICGISGLTKQASSTAQITILLDSVNQANIDAQAIIVPKVTGTLPSMKLKNLDELRELNLADPQLDKPGFIGLLLGLDVAVKLFKTNEANRLSSDGKLLLQPTHLGWIVSGQTTNPSSVVTTYVTTNESLHKLSFDDDLKKKILDFYEIPEAEEETPDEQQQYCEQTYQQLHYRLPDGRYVVPIPWKQDAPQLGHSYRKAIKLFKGQEGKWMKDAAHYELSNQFMKEYEKLGHMTRILPQDERKDSNQVYYIPYLSVLRKNALTTKLRNVFNASMPSSNGVSLNDTMHEGPKLQTHIKDILLAARSFRFIYSADISKMFRQILVRAEDRDKLRIVWRPAPNVTLQEYRLTTVTYGTDAAPYLAIRTMHQCADDNTTPEIAQIIKKAFYMDDLLYGADNIEEAKYQIKNINNALLAGQLPLTKWMTNNLEILTDISNEHKIANYLPANQTRVKILGMTYDFDNDNFALNYTQPEVVKFTKRGISSIAASFYDPLGLILPFIMLLRIFLQDVWKEKVDWDDKVKTELQEKFLKQIAGINKLNSINIPRYIACDNDNKLELIGFSDASSQAQAAVIYSRVKTCNGFNVTLLTSKGNVSKLKTKAVLESNQCTIPKLELEALVTLAELYNNIKHCLGHRLIEFTAYTDSMVALSWVRNKPSTKVSKFIERRVVKIKDSFEPQQLHYVKSDENPADPASRGLTAEQLSSCTLWFLGPPWLQKEILPSTPFQEKEEESESKVLATHMYQHEDGIFDHISTLTRTLRTIAYCLRWRNKTKGILTAEEIHVAKQRLIKYYQQLHMPEVFTTLENTKSISKHHWVRQLSPFLDNNGILRVGGRLENADFLAESQKHPIIIPKCHMRTLLVNHAHHTNGHAGNSLTFRILVEEYWITSLRQVIQKCIRHCTKCIRWKAAVIQPHMSQLPSARITPSTTFEQVGVDLSGPFIIKASPLKFDRTMKVWVVNFVCMSTKATHLEIVSNLSTEHFLSALTRFCSRRGTSSDIWSDNGTNLKGANRLIKSTWENILKTSADKTSMQQISWHFIPRHSPTFGGLWEACVKSMKYFVKRMSSTQNLTYEEFETLLCKIEALLNSRPLFRNPSSPEEYPALTPFHFINQKGYKPSPIDGTNKTPLTKKWYNIKQIQLDFWTRFKTEYLRELQLITKWWKPRPNLKINDVVLIKEPSTTPGDWKMGRVVQTYPDPAGVVRKVDIFTPSKEKKLHAVNQLVPLLQEETINEITRNNDIATDGENSKRQNSKRKCKASLVHLCLLVMMIWSPSTASANLDFLQDGVNIRKLNDVYVKTFDLQFSVKTQLNLTHDLQIIKKTKENFDHECTNLSQGSDSARSLCNAFQPSIQERAKQVTQELIESYPSRQKRWLGITSKTIWKAAPAIATTLGMVYQENQILNLQDKLADTQKKMQKTINVLLNITDIEYNNIELKLNEVILKQQDVLLQETISNYAQSIELLFEKVKSQHNDVINIKPTAEFNKFIQPILEKMVDTTVPPIGDDLFRLFAPVKSIQDDNTVVTFNIPMVSKSKFHHWLLISIAKPNGQTTLLPNNRNIQRIIVDNQNITYADVTNIEQKHDQVVEGIHTQPIPTCLDSIFSTPQTTTGCGDTFKTTTFDDIITLPNGLAVLFKNNQRQQIECNGHKKVINTTVIFDRSLCTIISNNTANIAMQALPLLQQTDDFNTYNAITPIENQGITPLHRSHEVIKMRDNLKEEWSTNWVNPTPAILVTGGLVLGTVITYLAIIVRCLYCNRVTKPQSDLPWFPNYEGPRMTPITRQ